MSTQVICINNQAPLFEAKQLMKEKRIRHLPVANYKNEIVGIFTERDLIGTDRFQDLPVEIFASPNVEYVTADTPLRNVALKMLEKKISCVLLTDDQQKLVGILTTDDLLFHLTQLLDPNHHNEENPTLFNKVKSLAWIETVGEFSKKLSDIGI